MVLYTGPCVWLDKMSFNAVECISPPRIRTVGHIFQWSVLSVHSEFSNCLSVDLTIVLFCTLKVAETLEQNAQTSWHDTVASQFVSSCLLAHNQITNEVTRQTLSDSSLFSYVQKVAAVKLKYIKQCRL